MSGILQNIAAQDSLLYKNPEQPITRRVEDLISRMTVEEKISLMMDVARAVPRLDVPEYNW